MKKLTIICILILSVVFISGCTSDETNSETSTEAPTPQETKLDSQEVLSIRQNYVIELNDWERAKCFTDSFTDDLKLDLKVANNNEDKKLEYLTIRVNQYDSLGELIGWGRTSIRVRTLEPQTSDYALPCIKGALSLTTTVNVEIEENPPKESYKFFKELQ